MYGKQVRGIEFKITNHLKQNFEIKLETLIFIKSNSEETATSLKSKIDIYLNQIRIYENEIKSKRIRKTKQFHELVNPTVKMSKVRIKFLFWKE